MAYQRVSDCVGLPLTCCTKEAVELYNKGLFAYLSQCESPTPYVSEALRLDPTLILGHCFMGNIWLSELRLPNGPEGHVLEEAWDAEESVEFLTSTRKDWADTAIGGHITWHLTLRYLDLGDINSVVREYDTVLVKRAVPNNYLGLRDATSLLWRLNLLGVDTGGRWKQVVESCSEHIQQPTTSWVDVHLMMSLAHGKVTESTARLVLAEQLIKAMKEYAESNVSVHCKITDTLGIPVCNALLAYGKEQYSEVVGLLLPLRYDIRRMGGSWAQRQVFSLTLIQAAIKSNQHSLALALVAELKAQKPKNKQLFKLFQELKQHVTVKRRDKANLSRELIPY